jgi:hypothetical protein
VQVCLCPHCQTVAGKKRMADTEHAV